MKSEAWCVVSEDAVAAGLDLKQWRQRIFDELLAAHCDKWQSSLHLEHWRIEFEMASVIGDDPETHAHCTVRTTDGHRATIRFSDALLEHERDWQEETVVHELVHIILDDACQYAYQNMPEGQHAWFTRLVETVVADLCRVLMDMDRRVKDGQEA